MVEVRISDFHTAIVTQTGQIEIGIHLGQLEMDKSLLSVGDKQIGIVGWPGYLDTFTAAAVDVAFAAGGVAGAVAGHAEDDRLFIWCDKKQVWGVASFDGVGTTARYINVK